MVKNKCYNIEQD